MVKILIVEDNKEVLDSMYVAFKRQFEVDTALSYGSAIALLQNNKYDVVLTDGAIPENDGWGVGNHGTLSEGDYRGSQVAEFARSKGISVIGITSEPKMLKNCTIVLKKPADLQEVRDLIENYSAKK